ncbi:hypothetical protein B566_EDAN002355 [Ephemera danica]|nr:hypothetical protein B566_EDAN002355 [Ephemera danica]
MIDRLETRETMNFDIFAEVWREMTFSLIFRGRKSDHDMLDLCETLLLAAKTCWLPPNSAERRLLAAYLMYGTYVKQPFRGAAKIKVTKSEWDEIVDFLLVEKHKAMEMLYMLKEQKLVPRESSDITKLIRSGIFDNIANAADNYEAEKLFGIERNLVPHKSMPTTTDGLNLGQELRNLCLRRSLVKNTNQKPSFKTKPKNRRRALKQLCMSKIAVPRNPRFRISGVSVDTVESPLQQPQQKETAKQRKRRERGYYLTTRFKQHRDLEGFPTEG